MLCVSLQLLEKEDCAPGAGIPKLAVTWGGVGAVVFSGAKQTWIQSQCLLAGTVGKVISTPLSPISLIQVEPSCNIEGHSEDEDL